MSATLREQVRHRASDCCEYCQTPQSQSFLPHELDHIRAQRHQGPTKLENLAWSCAACNNAKGTDASAFIPGTDTIVRLFNPRTDRWDEHFEWDGPLLRAKTDIGKATVELLKINSILRIEKRRILIENGLFPLPANE
jgi:hypothetical protein